MTTLVSSATVIRLEAGCCDSGLPDRFLTQLGVPKYQRGASVMTVPESLEEWRDEHRTARKRADRCARFGYEVCGVSFDRWADDIFEINTSLPERQGRPMTEGYVRRRDHSRLPDYPCDRHKIHTLGVIKKSRLVAYMTLYRCGELALVSMILGHGAYLRDDIMYLLAVGMIQHEAGQGGFLFYNSHASGTDGLRYYKERIGFRSTDVEFVL